MTRPASDIEAAWEYEPAPDAEERVRTAFELIFSRTLTGSCPQPQNLTENYHQGTMPHDQTDKP